MPRADPLRNGPLCDLSVGLGAQGQAGGGGRSIIRSIILGRLPVRSGRAKQLLLWAHKTLYLAEIVIAMR